MNCIHELTALPPHVHAPADAQAVFVTLRATERDAAACREHLMKVIPVTSQASGCRYSDTYQSPSAPTGFLLLQGWDSVEQQQAHIAWRESTGDLAEFGSFLVGPPTVEVFALIDA